MNLITKFVFDAADTCPFEPADACLLVYGTPLAGTVCLVGAAVGFAALVPLTLRYCAPPPPPPSSSPSSWGGHRCDAESEPALEYVAAWSGS